MGSHDLFKKRREPRSHRKSEVISPRSNSYLIVSEGTETEPNYFLGIKKQIERCVGGNVNVVSIPRLEISGEGVSTVKLIEATKTLVKRANILYQNVWVLFDKDDFCDFDKAIKMGEQNGYNVAWSNQSFEYWLYLHFDYCDSALHRSEWERKLNILFKKKTGRKYDKNLTDIYDIVSAYGKVEDAIKNARRRMKRFDDTKYLPSKYDPGTTVYLLVEDLMKYIF